MRHCIKFRTDRSKRFRDMAIFRFWKMAAVRHLGFWKLEILTDGTVRKANMRYHAKFYADRSNRFRDMLIFQFFKMAAVRHLGFLKVRNFNRRHSLEGQFASPRQIWCRSVNAFGDMATFRFFSKWRPYAILNLFHASLDHPRREFGGLCHCAKFGWNRFSSFVNMRILIFCALGLKLPIHAHFLGRGVLGPLDP